MFLYPLLYFSDIIEEVTTYLPVVNKYFHFAEALELSFLQPVEVVSLTHEGNVIMNDKEGISIHVPNGAIPVGRRLPIEIGSAMHGRLSFPEGFHPVSPILWICPQEQVDILKPFKITLPHTVKYEKGVTELFFLKACHNEDLPLATQSTEWTGFTFEEMAHHEGTEFNNVYGSVYTKRFCCICIADNVQRPTKKRYLLHRTQPLQRNTLEFTVDYCITFDLPNCIEVSRIVWYIVCYRFLNLLFLM